MQRQIFIKVVAAVGLACALGIGWALATPRVQDVQELQLEIPLYEGAQVQWEAHLAAPEMAQGLAQWAQELSVLRIAGYTIESERALDVLDFYDQTLSGWRRIIWTRPDEAGGVRLFAHDQLPLASYLLILVSKRYGATDLTIVTGQVAEIPEVPIFEGAELQWEVVLTTQDLLEHLKRWLGDLIKNPPLAMRTRIWGQPERPQDSLIEAMSWLGILGIEMISRLLLDFSELRVVGYRIDLITVPQVLDFYEQQFSGWRCNLWIKPEESAIRVFTRSDAQGLQELVAFIIMPGSGMRVSEVHTNVIVLRARR